MIRFLALLGLLAAPCLAQAGPPAALSPAAVPGAPRPATVKVRLVTSEGPIVLELEKERAPITTANFLRYVDQRKFDGTSFYRALTVTGDPTVMGLLQGGVRGDGKRSLPPITLEPTSRTGLSHVDGTVSMARAAPNSATGDFFIVVGPLTTLDANPAQAGDNQGFAAFGHVVDGMDLVRSLLSRPKSATEGGAAMKGQILAAPVKIVSARREP
jgi:peptidyl-prolyl cis-trans isomerase A (cyclophilin A)